MPRNHFCRNNRYRDDTDEFSSCLPRGYHHGNYDDKFSRQRRLAVCVDDNYSARKGSLKQALTIRAEEGQLMYKSARQINREEQLESHIVRNENYRRMSGVSKKLIELMEGKTRVKSRDSKRKSRLANLSQQIRQHQEVLYVVKDNLIKEQHILERKWPRNIQKDSYVS